jgi:hypothetical protein
MRMQNMAAILFTWVLLGFIGTAQAGAQSGCAELGGTVQEDNICHLRTVTPAYTLDFTFPTDYPDEQALTDYLVQSRDGFVNVAQMPGSRGLPYEMDAAAQRFRSGAPPQGTHSVALKIFQDVGGANPVTWYKAFNFDLGLRQPLTFDKLFAPGVRPLDTVFPIVARQLERQTGMNGAISPGAGLDPAHYQNFAITDDELIFFFSQNELLPSSAGATVAHVPRTAIPPLLV